MTMANNKKEHSMNHQKQSQSNPIYIVLICVHSWLNSKQTQTNPICGDQSRTTCPERSRRVCSELADFSLKNLLTI
jgi:hypothetical protein